MIIKSIFRRYEKWNPVHPTHGAFWGMGVGIGCGVGWGPGFGPDVIGYVGAGCGAGFSVGITFIGLGIGFPANHLFTVPYTAFTVTRQGALDVARARGLLGNRSHAVEDGFKIENLMKSTIDLEDVKGMLVFRVNHITNCLQRVTQRLFPWDKGPKS
ncbi:hypothetical protein ACJIZ3_004229 [Penstemon smallii]|uniref:Cadmium-induced protein AS8 n=1 Tax=Penstemon smallii TaxID=265156 RepID=A0ABD3S1F6_9LAMI